MSIYDGNGNAVQSNRKLIHSSNRYDRGLPYMPDFARDIDTMFNDWDWRTVMSGSRSVCANNGVVKAAINQKADAIDRQ